MISCVYHNLMGGNVVYAFIDSQNLNLGIRSLGWKLDFCKFRVYLKDKYHVKKAFLFIGYIPQNKKLYRILRKAGYELVFKPTVAFGKSEIKGNVDAELVLYAAKIEYKNYDKAIIVSGDGDFYCLHGELLKDGKLLKILVPSRKSESSLLSHFWNYKEHIEDLKLRLERVK